jgi:hypothetical protein
MLKALKSALEQEGGELLAKEPTARDFVADAFAHMKFIGYVDHALPLLKKAGVFEELDGGVPAAQGGRERQELRRQLPQASLLAARGPRQASVAIGTFTGIERSMAG